jgi:hypothetical protein
LEQFCQGRSAAWYWRQTLVAILVGFAKELSILGVAVGFTGLWIGALLYCGRLWTTTPLQRGFGWGVRLPWPASGVYVLVFFTAVNTLPILMALSIYLGVTKSFSLRGLTRGLLLGSFTWALTATFGVMVLPPLRQQDDSDFAKYVIGSVPFFFALLLSVRAARPNNAGRMSTKTMV